MQLTGRQIAYRSGAERWTARVEKEELRADGRLHHFLTGIRAQDASGAEIGVPGSGGSEWLRLDSSGMTWSDDYGHEDEPFELCAQLEGILPASAVLQETFPGLNCTFTDPARLSVRFDDSLQTMTVTWLRLDAMKNCCVAEFKDDVVTWRESTNVSGGAGFTVDTSTSYRGRLSDGGRLRLLVDGSDGSHFELVEELGKFSTQSLGKPPTGAAPRAGGGGGGGAAADAEPEPAPQPLPPVPPSPMSGRTLASSNFRVAYTKTKAPDSLMKLGAKLGDLIKTYCIAHSIPYDDDEGEAFFDQLMEDMDAGGNDSVPEAVQRMWTSFRQLRGCEFCAIMNEAARDDEPNRMAPAAALTRAITKLCVTPDEHLPQPPFPPDFICFRGGGFDDKYRDFFAPGREFRQPAFLATSFLESKVDLFISRSTVPVKVKWLVRIDPELKCRHVNLVTKRVPGLPDEQEYLFAPYSAFTVVSTKWGAGTSADPHSIELLAAPDNKVVSERLPLAPWS